MISGEFIPSFHSTTRKDNINILIQIIRFPTCADIRGKQQFTEKLEADEDTFNLREFNEDWENNHLDDKPLDQPSKAPQSSSTPP